MASSKAEKREERKKLKQEKAQKLADKFTSSSQIKEIKAPPQRECPKTPITPQDRAASVKKLPSITEKPAIYSTTMTWCHSLADIEDYWTWGESRKWTESEWTSEILRELEPLTKLTWSEIARMETGEGKKRKRRKRHHPQPISSIISEAQQRWSNLSLEQFDTAYRFRLGGTKRVWGFQCCSHFYMVWYEREHKIYPV